jgi:small conductance mechanosensitive channel
METLIPILTTWGINIAGVLIALWVSMKMSSWLQRQITRQLQARNFDATLSVFFGNLAKWAILVSAVLACLSIFGIQTTSFAAIIGAAGLAIGLSFQGTLSNFAAGVMILVFRPFKIGDLIQVDGVVGVVAEIGLFTVSMDSPDNRRFIVPNSAAIAGKIENMTHNALRRVDIDVGCDYSADIDHTRAILDAAAATVPGRDPEAGHQIFLAGLGGSSVDWQVRIWADPAIYWDVYQATIRATKMALDEAGIGIPFPQMDVHMDKAA